MGFKLDRSLLPKTVNYYKVTMNGKADFFLVSVNDYNKLAIENKSLKQNAEVSDNAYQKLMFDYQSLLIEYGKLVKGSK